MTRRLFSALVTAAPQFPERQTDSISASGTPGKINRLDLFTNQVGYLAHGMKTFVAESNGEMLLPKFFIRDIDSLGDGKKVYEGKLQHVDGDFGSYLTGDFSDFQTPGRFVLTVPIAGYADGISSQVFEISERVYDNLIGKGLSFYSLQRCGPSTTGYHSPCHLDDGVRADNGRFLDVTGGWHDASDLLKWTNATIVSLVVLPHLAERSNDPKLRARIFEEVQWGNLYFRKLQDPQGYIYEHGIGGDPVEEGNHFTDNVRGTRDDRKIATRVGTLAVQHIFISAQASIAEVYKEWDPPYAEGCLNAANRCFAWVRSRQSKSYLDMGTGAHAGAQLYRATGNQDCETYAAIMANGFANLQQRNGGLKGFFFEDDSKTAGASHVFHSPLGIIGFARSLDLLKKSRDVGPWEQALRLYCDEYVSRMAQRNAFGIVPFQVQLPESLRPGARAVDGVTYRYFMCPLHGNWWVGSNANIAGTGVVLCEAARLLGSDSYRSAAQRLLDWILGQNPFDVSMMIGLGHKNPPEYIFTGFQPRTPRADGGVICGIAGDHQDRPSLLPGAYNTCELWSPMLALTMWLASELMNRVP